jgi:hypothetical protein
MDLRRFHQLLPRNATLFRRIGFDETTIDRQMRPSGHVVTVAIRHPDICPIECHARGVGSHCERAEDLPVAGPQLAHVIAAVICYPDVCPIKGQASRPVSRGERAENFPVAGPQLGYVVAADICHPDVGPIKGHANGVTSDGEGAEDLSVADSSSFVPRARSLPRGIQLRFCSDTCAESCTD